MGDKILRRNYIISCLKINLFTSFGINLGGGGDTVSYVDCTDLFSFVGGKSSATSLADDYLQR